MINQEITVANSIVYLSDNSRSKFGKGQKKLIECVNAFLIEAQSFLHSPRQIGTKYSKSMGIEVSVTLCGSGKIRRLNKDYRGKDKVTDVLSFPLNETLRSSSPMVMGTRCLGLGDIVICRDVTKAQAESFNITYEQELVHLLTHGFLHLCGFDHELSDAEEVIMNKHEQLMVRKIYKRLGYE